VEANNTGGQGSRRAVAPSHDDDDDDDDDDQMFHKLIQYGVSDNSRQALTVLLALTEAQMSTMIRLYYLVYLCKWFKGFKHLYAWSRI
jgi:hypothetical protein